jgi:hypothetical protein
MELLLREQMTANAVLQQEILKHATEVAKALAATTTTLGNYMTAATVAATPQVRPMDDWTEAAMERSRKEARLAEPQETLKALGISSKDIEKEMSEFFTDIRNDFGGMA